MPAIDIKTRASHTVTRLPEKHQGQIGEALKALKIDPTPQDSKYLAGMRPLRRQDVGEYRIVYWFDLDNEIVRVPLIGKRNGDEVFAEIRRLMQYRPITLERLKRTLR